MTKKTQNRDTEIHRELASFSNYLKRKGLKITNQRLLVAEKIFRSDHHFTVDSLAEKLRDRRDEISRATIYRIVSLMVDSGQLAEHNFGQSMKYYEHRRHEQHHDHIVCQDCGHIFEFVESSIERIQREVAERNGFELDDHSLILYGRCHKRRAGEECEHYTAAISEGDEEDEISDNISNDGKE